MNPALHVAVVTETYPPEVNGVAMTIGRMVHGLLARGHRVSLIRPRQSAGDGTDAQLPTTLVRGLPIPGYPGLKFGLPARRLLARKWLQDRPDVIQVVTEGPLGASAIAAARALGIPVVSEFHTNFHAYSRHYGFGWLERLVAGHLRRLHNRSRFALVPSRELADQLLADGYRRIRVVSRGVDTRLFHPGRRSAALRTHWGVGPATPVMAYVGRLAPEKNLPLVLQTFDALHRHDPEARLLLVGDGPSRRHIDANDPRYIIAGMRHGEDLARHYASADLFLFPSTTETYGNVTLEALASGLPVIAYRMAAAAELVRHGQTGMLATPDASAEFIRAALDFFLSPGLMQNASRLAGPSVSHRDWEQIHDRLVETLREAISMPPPPDVRHSLLGLATD
jgi:glycosyltransferase involved in cell wall biosynthesis